MSKLYPPIINGTIPAFYGATLVVPFSINKAVSEKEISKVIVKIKTINGSIKDAIEANKVDLTSGYAAFSINSADYTLGQYYKVQIAFIDIYSQVGYYSTVGITKYTTKPSVFIEGLSFGTVNSHIYNYTGVYSQKNGDSTEKMHSGRFRVYNGKNELVDDTGWVLHDITSDEKSYEAVMSYTLPLDFPINEVYSIQFSVMTKNAMEINSVKYRLNQKRSVKPAVDFDFVSSLDTNNGLVSLRFENSRTPVVSGNFLITREGSDEPGVWQELKRLTLHSVHVNEWEYIDCTVAHGITYQYAIQQYNNKGIYSDKICTKKLLVQYEDAFLFDGDKQLRIRFNPKISSFKKNYSEQKIETIGKQHPFIIRNGNVSYREFPISGLISYKMDEDKNLFLTSKEIDLTENTSNLTPENMASERIFKMKVLDWLSNGEPKLFRSPAEGNYIVRLMNVSLSPNDTLGRMLHTFSATAYELAEFSNHNLEEYGIIDASSGIEEQTQWSSIELRTINEKTAIFNEDNFIVLQSNRLMYSIQFIDMEPGSIIKIDNEKIVIGITGAYSVNSNIGFYSVSIDPRFINQGIFTYSYKSTAANMFGIINDLNLITIPVRQFFGRTGLTTDNLLTDIQNVFQELTSVTFLRFTKRNLIDIYVAPDFNIDEMGTEILYEDDPEKYIELLDAASFYTTMEGKTSFDRSSLDLTTIYHIRYLRGGNTYSKIPHEQYHVDRIPEQYSIYTDFYLDGSNNKIFHKEDNDFYVTIDGEDINIEEIEKYIVAIPDEVSKVTVNNGVISEIGYTLQEISYSFEDSDENVKKLKNRYIDALNRYKTLLTKEATEEDILKQREQVYAQKNAYDKILTQAIKEYKEAYGIL